MDPEENTPEIVTQGGDEYANFVLVQISLRTSGILQFTVEPEYVCVKLGLQLEAGFGSSLSDGAC